MKINITLRRVVAGIAVGTFIVSHHNVPNAFGAVQPNEHKDLPAANFPEDLSKIKVPEDIGKIEESFKGQDGRVVVLVQDAHAIFEAQRNIQKIITHFQNKYGLGLVGVEGASSKLDPQIFKSFPDKEILEKTFEAYLEKGELTGTTAAAIFHAEGGSASGGNETIFQGIEDWPLYEKGLGLYMKAMSEKEKLGEQVQAANSQLQAEKEKAYSKELLAIDKALGSFQKNDLDLMTTLKTLAQIKAPEKGSELALLLDESEKEGADMEMDREVREIAEKIQKAPDLFLGSDTVALNQKLQEFQTSRISAGEFALFLKEILDQTPVQKKGTGKNALPVPFSISERLSHLMKNDKRLRDIEGTKLFRDFERYAQSVKESVFRNEEERQLDTRSRRLELLEKMVKLELSREEWNEMKAFKADESLELSNHFAFYENAEKRDEAFFKNLSGRMKKEGLNASLLVTGGFHTEGLTERLKRAGISYTLITPQIGSVPKNSPYAQQMQGNVSWKDYFQVENGKINLYKAFVRGARDQLLIASPVSRHLLKTWRDQIIRDLSRKKEITKTREYVHFLDEISRNNTKDEVHGPQGLARIDRFIARLRHLESTHRLTEENVLRLLQPAAYGVPATQSQIAIGSDLSIKGDGGVPLMPAVPITVEKSKQIINEARLNPDNTVIGIRTPRRRAEVRDEDEKHGNALVQILSGLWNPLKEEKVGAEEVLDKKEQFTASSGGGLLGQEGISQFTRRNLYKWGLLGLLTGVMSRGVSGQTELKARQFSEEQKAAWKTILKSQGFEEERMNRILAASPESARIFLVRELAKSMVERSFEIRQHAKLYRDAASAVSPRLASLVEAWIERLGEPVEKKIHLLDEMNEKYFGPAGTLIESRQAGRIWMPVLHRAEKFSDVEKLTFGEVTVHVIYGDRPDGIIDRRAGFRLGRIQTAFINKRVHLNNAELFHRLVHDPAKPEPPVDDMSLYRQLSISLLKKDLEGLTVDQSAEKQMQSTLHNELLHAYEIAKGIDQDGHHETRSDLNQVVATDIPFHAIAHIAGNVLMGGDYGIQSADTLDLIYEEAKKRQLIKVDPEKEIKESIAGALKRLGVKDALLVLNERLAAFNQLKPDQKEGLRRAAKSAFQNRFKSPLPANFSIKIEKPILSAVTQNMAAHLSARAREFRSHGGVTENELAELSNVIYWRDHLLYEDGWISDSIAGILQPVFAKAARQVLGNRSPQSSQERLAVLEKTLEILTEGTDLQPETPLVSGPTDQQGSPFSWGPVLIGAVGLSIAATAGFFIYRRMHKKSRPTITEVQLKEHLKPVLIHYGIISKQEEVPQATVSSLLSETGPPYKKGEIKKALTAANLKIPKDNVLSQIVEKLNAIPLRSEVRTISEEELNDFIGYANQLAEALQSYWEVPEAYDGEDAHRGLEGLEYLGYIGDQLRDGQISWEEFLKFIRLSEIDTYRNELYHLTDKGDTFVELRDRVEGLFEILDRIKAPVPHRSEVRGEMLGKDDNIKRRGQWEGSGQHGQFEKGASAGLRQGFQSQKVSHWEKYRRQFLGRFLWISLPSLAGTGYTKHPLLDQIQSSLGLTFLFKPVSGDQYKPHAFVSDHNFQNLTTEVLLRQIPSFERSLGFIGIGHRLFNHFKSQFALRDALTDVVSIIKYHILYDIYILYNVKPFYAIRRFVRGLSGKTFDDQYDLEHPRSEVRMESLGESLEHLFEEMDQVIRENRTDMLRNMKLLRMYGSGVLKREMMEYLFRREPLLKAHQYARRRSLIEELFFKEYIPGFRQHSPEYRQLEKQTAGIYKERGMKRQRPVQNSYGELNAVMGAVAVVRGREEAGRMARLIINDAASRLNVPSSENASESMAKITGDVWKATPLFDREGVEQKLTDHVAEIEAILGFQFPSEWRDALKMSLTESVFLRNTTGKRKPTHFNRRLSVLGDALLEEWMASRLRETFTYEGTMIATPKLNPQDIALLISNRVFNRIMQRTGLLNHFIRIPGLPDEKEGVHSSGDSFEALLAAVYLAGGPNAFDAAAKRLYAKGILESEEFNVQAILREVSPSRPFDVRSELRSTNFDLDRERDWSDLAVPVRELLEQPSEEMRTFIEALPGRVYDVLYHSIDRLMGREGIGEEDVFTAQAFLNFLALAEIWREHPNLRGTIQTRFESMPADDKIGIGLTLAQALQNILDGIRRENFAATESIDAILQRYTFTGRSLQGHLNEVASVAYSPDGNRLASGSWDRSIRIWDLATGETLFTLWGHTDRVESVAYSPDGTRLASGSADGSIRIWDLQTGETLLILQGNTGGVYSVAYSPDGKRLASGSWDRSIRIWDLQTSESLVTLEGHTEWVESVAYSPEGKRLASGSHDRSIRIWDLKTGETLHTLQGSTGGVNIVAYSRDGTRLASGSWDGSIKIWDLATGETLVTLQSHTDGVLSVAYSPDGTRLASGSHDGSVRMWDLSRLTLPENFPPPSLARAEVRTEPSEEKTDKTDDKEAAAGEAGRQPTDAEYVQGINEILYKDHDDVTQDDFDWGFRVVSMLALRMRDTFPEHQAEIDALGLRLDNFLVLLDQPESSEKLKTLTGKFAAWGRASKKKEILDLLDVFYQSLILAQKLSDWNAHKLKDKNGGQRYLIEYQKTTALALAAYQIKSDDPEMLIQLAMAYLHSRQKDKAEELLLPIVQTGKANRKARNALGFVKYEQAHDKLGELKAVLGDKEVKLNAVFLLMQTLLHLLTESATQFSIIIAQYRRDKDNTAQVSRAFAGRSAVERLKNKMYVLADASLALMRQPEDYYTRLALESANHSLTFAIQALEVKTKSKFSTRHSGEFYEGALQILANSLEDLSQRKIVPKMIPWLAILLDEIHGKLNRALNVSAEADEWMKKAQHELANIKTKIQFYSTLKTLASDKALDLLSKRKFESHAPFFDELRKNVLKEALRLEPRVMRKADIKEAVHFFVQLIRLDDLDFLIFDAYEMAKDDERTPEQIVETAAILSPERADKLTPGLVKSRFKKAEYLNLGLKLEKRERPEDVRLKKVQVALVHDIRPYNMERVKPLIEEDARRLERVNRLSLLVYDWLSAEEPARVKEIEKLRKALEERMTPLLEEFRELIRKHEQGGLGENPGLRLAELKKQREGFNGDQGYLADMEVLEQIIGVEIQKKIEPEILAAKREVSNDRDRVKGLTQQYGFEWLAAIEKSLSEAEEGIDNLLFESNENYLSQQMLQYLTSLARETYARQSLFSKNLEKASVVNQLLLDVEGKTLSLPESIRGEAMIEIGLLKREFHDGVLSSRFKEYRERIHKALEEMDVRLGHLSHLLIRWKQLQGRYEAGIKRFEAVEGVPQTLKEEIAQGLASLKNQFEAMNQAPLSYHRYGEYENQLEDLQKVINELFAATDQKIAEAKARLREARREAVMPQFEVLKKMANHITHWARENIFISPSVEDKRLSQAFENIFGEWEKLTLKEASQDDINRFIERAETVFTSFPFHIKATLWKDESRIDRQFFGAVYKVLKYDMRQPLSPLYSAIQQYNTYQITEFGYPVDVSLLFMDANGRVYDQDKLDKLLSQFYPTAKKVLGEKSPFRKNPYERWKTLPPEDRLPVFDISDTLFKALIYYLYSYRDPVRYPGLDARTVLLRAHEYAVREREGREVKMPHEGDRYNNLGKGVFGTAALRWYEDAARFGAHGRRILEKMLDTEGVFAKETDPAALANLNAYLDRFGENSTQELDAKNPARSEVRATPREEEQKRQALRASIEKNFEDLEARKEELLRVKREVARELEQLTRGLDDENLISRFQRVTGYLNQISTRREVPSLELHAEDAALLPGIPNQPTAEDLRGIAADQRYPGEMRDAAAILSDAMEEGSLGDGIQEAIYQLINLRNALNTVRSPSNALFARIGSILNEYSGLIYSLPIYAEALRGAIDLALRSDVEITENERKALTLDLENDVQLIRLIPRVIQVYSNQLSSQTANESIIQENIRLLRDQRNHFSVISTREIQHDSDGFYAANTYAVGVTLPDGRILTSWEKRDDIVEVPVSELGFGSLFFSREAFAQQGIVLPRSFVEAVERINALVIQRPAGSTPVPPSRPANRPSEPPTRLVLPEQRPARPIQPPDRPRPPETRSEVRNRMVAVPEIFPAVWAAVVVDQTLTGKEISRSEMRKASGIIVTTGAEPFVELLKAVAAHAGQSEVIQREQLRLIQAYKDRFPNQSVSLGVIFPEDMNAPELEDVNSALGEIHADTLVVPRRLKFLSVLKETGKHLQQVDFSRPAYVGQDALSVAVLEDLPELKMDGMFVPFKARGARKIEDYFIRSQVRFVQLLSTGIASQLLKENPKLKDNPNALKAELLKVLGPQYANAIHPRADEFVVNALEIRVVTEYLARAEIRKAA